MRDYPHEPAEHQLGYAERLRSRHLLLKPGLELVVPLGVRTKLMYQHIHVEHPHGYRRSSTGTSASMRSSSATLSSMLAPSAIATNTAQRLIDKPLAAGRAVRYSRRGLLRPLL